MLGRSIEISRESRQIQTTENPSKKNRGEERRVTQGSRPLRRATELDAGTKYRSPVRFVEVAGGSQSLHSSDDQREPNPLRAKGGRKVDSERSNT